jgi:hypothetical protein
VCVMIGRSQARLMYRQGRWGRKQRRNVRKAKRKEVRCCWMKVEACGKVVLDLEEHGKTCSSCGQVKGRQGRR